MIQIGAAVGCRVVWAVQGGVQATQEREEKVAYTWGLQDWAGKNSNSQEEGEVYLQNSHDMEVCLPI